VSNSEILLGNEPIFSPIPVSGRIRRIGPGSAWIACQRTVFTNIQHKGSVAKGKKIFNEKNIEKKMAA